MVVSLAFVPIQDLDVAFDGLCRYLPREFRPILDWFEKYYLGLLRLGRRQRATFPPPTWNVYERVLTRWHRTNNYAEAAHRFIDIFC